MRKRTTRSGSFVYGLAGVLVGALLVTALPALGATGDNLVVGVSNRSGRSTWLASRGPSVLKLNNTAGNPALDLRNGGASAPMLVDSGVVVAGFNADELDGQDSTAFLGAAAKATDADLVDGLHANQLVRVAHTETINVDETAVFGSNNFGDILTTQITAPTAGLLFMVAGTESYLVGSGAIGDLFRCQLHVNDSEVTGSRRAVRVSVIDATHTSNDNENCSTNGVQEVAAGTHHIDLYIINRNISSPQVYFGNASLQVLFVPFGADGT